MLNLYFFNALSENSIQLPSARSQIIDDYIKYQKTLKPYSF